MTIALQIGIVKYKEHHFIEPYNFLLCHTFLS
jgi:hypothetical protein